MDRSCIFLTGIITNRVDSVIMKKFCYLIKAQQTFIAMRHMYPKADAGPKHLI